MRAGDDMWVDRDSGPVVRPYALTGGRTEPATGEMLDLISIVARSGAGTSYPDTLPTRAGKQYFDGENPHVSNAGQGAPLLYNSRASSFLTVKIL